MSSKRSKEGWLLIENRHAPPMDPRIIAASGKDVVEPGIGTFESATITCSHCTAVVVLNPNRSREREWCFRCDHYICDPCGAAAKTKACVPMAKRIEEMQTAAIRSLGKG